jgi:hypothetical protein
MEIFLWQTHKSPGVNNKARFLMQKNCVYDGKISSTRVPVIEKGSVNENGGTAYRVMSNIFFWVFAKKLRKSERPVPHISRYLDCAAGSLWAHVYAKPLSRAIMAYKLSSICLMTSLPMSNAYTSDYQSLVQRKVSDTAKSEISLLTPANAQIHS